VDGFRFFVSCPPLQGELSDRFEWSSVGVPGVKCKEGDFVGIDRTGFMGGIANA
jgi:hypothetical protein